MSAGPLLSRRRFLLLSALFGGMPAFGGETGKPGGDNGIGGTGYRPGDNGIGGTGFIGIIRKFGSVYVNGQRIVYPDDAAIEIDGSRVEARDMRIGQVARLVAEQRDQTWSTRRIVIVSEVVGPVERIAGRQADILGQSVQLPSKRIARALKVGDRVAIGGLRRPDQTIVASAVERREGGQDQIAGVLSRQADGATRIGAQAVSGVGDFPAGQRVVLRGGLESGVFVARETRRDADIAIAGVRQVSIETWVSRRDGGLETPGGLRIESQAGGFGTGGRLVVIDGELNGGRLIARKMEFSNPGGGFDPSGGRRGGGGGFGGGSGGGPDGFGAPPGAGPHGGAPGPGGFLNPGGAGPGGGAVPSWLGGPPGGGLPANGSLPSLGGGNPPLAPGGAPAFPPSGAPGGLSGPAGGFGGPAGGFGPGGGFGGPGGPPGGRFH